MAVLPLSTVEEIFKDAGPDLDNLKAYPHILECFQNYAFEPVGAFMIAKRLQELRGLGIIQ